MKNGFHIDEFGNKSWYLNDLRHKLDGPAVIHPDDSQEWWLNGQLHREDGPAIINSSGYICWLQSGKYHRIDGPAIKYPSGTQEWWINDKRYSYYDWLEKRKPYLIQKNLKSIL